MITSKDLRLFRLALQIAELSEVRQKHGAVTALGSRVLGMGVNKKRTHPISHRFRQRATCHAEQIAIIKSRADLRGATLYSARYGGNQKSAPCDLCRFLMEEAGIEWVVYFDGYNLRKEHITSFGGYESLRELR